MSAEYNDCCSSSTTIVDTTRYNGRCNYGRMDTLATRLELAMKAAGVNQAELARKASTEKQPVTQQNIQQILSGRNKTSKHLLAIAAALNVSLDWLAGGRDDARGPRRKAVLVGKVGAGAEITRFDDGIALEEIEPPPGIDGCNAAEITGDSQYPLMEGWIVFYGSENQGVPEDCLGRLCVVQVKSGPTLLKTLKRGSRKGLYRLESWNAPPREDVRVAWAAKVLDIRPA